MVSILTGRECAFIESWISTNHGRVPQWTRREGLGLLPARCGAAECEVTIEMLGVENLADDEERLI